MNASKTPALFADRLKKAEKIARDHWGISGWANLTPEMRNAYVCQALVGLIAQLDFEAAFEGKESDDKSEKLMTRLVAITELCHQATLTEEK